MRSGIHEAGRDVRIWAAEADRITRAGGRGRAAGWRLAQKCVGGGDGQECAGGRRRRTGMRGRVGRERAAEMRGRAVEAHRDGRAGGRGRRACAGKQHG